MMAAGTQIQHGPYIAHSTKDDLLTPQWAREIAVRLHAQKKLHTGGGTGTKCQKALLPTRGFSHHSLKLHSPLTSLSKLLTSSITPFSLHLTPFQFPHQHPPPTWEHQVEEQTIRSSLIDVQSCGLCYKAALSVEVTDVFQQKQEFMIRKKAVQVGPARAFQVKDKSSVRHIIIIVVSPTGDINP